MTIYRMLCAGLLALFLSACGSADYYCPPPGAQIRIGDVPTECQEQQP